MICPNCGHVIDPKSAAKALGSIGGSTTGATKVRAVDYAALARLSHKKRKKNKLKRRPSP